MSVADQLKREGEMRAALRRQYFVRPGGIARWVEGREKKRKRYAEREAKWARKIEQENA